VLQLRRVVAGFSLRSPGFDRSSVHLCFVVNKLAMGQVLVRVIFFSPVSYIPSMLHTYLHLRVDLSWGMNGRYLGAFPTAELFLNITFHGKVFSLVDRNILKINVYLPSLRMKVPDHICLWSHTYMSHVLLLCESFLRVSVVLY
jgi:hypothetical protein